MKKLKPIIAILFISITLIHCKENEGDPDQYVAVDCACPQSGSVAVTFKDSITLTQAQSYSKETSNGVILIATGFQTTVSEDSLDFINSYLRFSKYSDDNVYAIAYRNEITTKVYINLLTGSDQGMDASRLDAIISEWMELSKDPIIKVDEFYSVSMVLKITPGTELSWIDVHSHDSQLTKAERFYLKCSC